MKVSKNLKIIKCTCNLYLRCFLISSDKRWHHGHFHIINENHSIHYNNLQFLLQQCEQQSMPYTYKPNAIQFELFSCVIFWLECVWIAYFFYEVREFQYFDLSLFVRPFFVIFTLYNNVCLLYCASMIQIQVYTNWCAWGHSSAAPPPSVAKINSTRNGQLSWKSIFKNFKWQNQCFFSRFLFLFWSKWVLVFLFLFVCVV